MQGPAHKIQIAVIQPNHLVPGYLPKRRDSTIYVEGRIPVIQPAQHDDAGDDEPFVLLEVKVRRIILPKQTHVHLAVAGTV